MYGFCFFFYKSTVTTNTVCVNTLQMMVNVRQNKKLACICKRWKQQKKLMKVIWYQKTVLFISILSQSNDFNVNIISKNIIFGYTN